MAGQEGFEPTTYGFGIRCSTVGATALQSILESYLHLLAFSMRSMLTAELAEFLEFQLVRRLLLVLGGGIILRLHSVQSKLTITRIITTSLLNILT